MGKIIYNFFLVFIANCYCISYKYYGGVGYFFKINVCDLICKNLIFSSKIKSKLTPLFPFFITPEIFQTMLSLQYFSIF